MKMIKINRTVAIVAVSCGLLIAMRPACAFVWPVIGAVELGDMVLTIGNVNSQVTNTINQLKNVNNLITTIGDQVSSIKKYAADLKGTITNIKASVSAVSENISTVTQDTADITKKINDTIVDVTKTEEVNAGQAVETVNERVEDEATQAEVSEVVADAKALSAEIKKSVDETIDNAVEKLNQAVNTSEATLDELLKTVTDEETGVAAEDREKITQRVAEIKEDIAALKEKSVAAITAAKEQYNTEHEEKVSAAYDEYNQAIEDYYAGKIDKAALTQAGEDFKSRVASLDISIDDDLIAELAGEAASISDDISQLREDILNSIGNAGDYSDGEEQTSLLINRPVTTAKTYAFNFRSGHNFAFFKAIYANGSDKTFLLSREFWCEKLGGEDKTPDWDTIKEKMKKIQEDPADFRDCVVKAKLEDTPTENQRWSDLYGKDWNKLYKKYQKNSVYMHISEDYNVANIVSMSKAKQVSTAWGNLDSKESTIYKLTKMFNDIDSTRNAYSLMGMTEIEAPKIWSQIRRVDAMNRAKEMVQNFDSAAELFLDGKDDDFKQATNDNPGTVKDKDCAEKENEAVVGKVVFPNVIMSICGLTSANEVSLPEVNKTDTKKANEIEQKIAKCLFLYAEAASKGTTGDNNTEANRQIWRQKQQKAYNDAAFGNLTLAVINNYKSSLDVLKSDDLPEEQKMNVVSIQKGLKESSTAKDDYAAGAQINYYTAQQLLSIVDADAQNQQTEIIKDLSTFDYNYFDTITETKNTGTGES